MVCQRETASIFRIRNIGDASRIAINKECLLPHAPPHLSCARFPLARE